MLLELIFSGAIGFVPVVEEHGQVMYALLVEARAPYRSSDGAFLPPHHPVVEIGVEHVKNGATILDDFDTGRAVLLDRPGDAEGRRLIWFLDREHLTIEAPGAVQGLAVDQGERPFTGGQTVPCLNNRGDIGFSWVPRMQDLSPTGGEINPQCLAQTPEPGLLAARMKLTSGVVSAFDRYTEEGTERFHFRSLSSAVPVSGHSRVLPGSVRIVMEIPGCEATIRATSLAHPNPETGAVTISVPNCQANSRVPVEIKNVLYQDVVEAGRIHNHALEDRHFELLYDLLRYPPPATRRPVPVSDRQGIDLRALGSACAGNTEVFDLLQVHLAPQGESLDIPVHHQILPTAQFDTLSSLILTEDFKCPQGVFIAPR